MKFKVGSLRHSKERVGPYLRTKPPAVVVNPGFPNSNAIVSVTRDPSGKMDSTQLVHSEKRTKRNMRDTRRRSQREYEARRRLELEQERQAKMAAAAALLAGVSALASNKAEGSQKAQNSYPKTEALAAIASGAMLEPLAGLAGIAGTALPGPSGQGARWVDNVRNQAYQPNDPSALNAIAGALSGPMSAYDKVMNETASKIESATGSLALADIARIAPEMLLSVAPIGGPGKFLGKGIKTQAEIAEKLKRASTRSNNIPEVGVPGVEAPIDPMIKWLSESRLKPNK